MKVLITGGGGFIGSHLVDSQLALGHQVRTVDLHVERLAHLTGHPNLQMVVGDIIETALVERLMTDVDVVYHLASAHLDVSLPADHYRRVNIDAAIQLVKMARTAGVRRVIHCSSVGVIGDVGKALADESSPCYPSNMYGETKLAGEQGVLDFAREANFPVVVARPAWVYGPRCPRTEKLFRAIKKGRFVFFGRGRNLRHPLYIADAIRGLELCAEVERAASQVYILAGERAVQVSTLVGLIAETLAVRPPVVRLPVALGWVAGYLFEMTFRVLGKQPPYSRRSMDFFIKNNAYNTRKAQQELGFQPQVGLCAGLAETHHRLITGGLTDGKGV